MTKLQLTLKPSSKKTKPYAPNNNRPTDRLDSGLFTQRLKQNRMNTININGKEYAKEEFHHLIKDWKVNKLFENIEALKTGPPTVRPMSELPENFYEAVLVIQERKKRYNMIVRKHQDYLVGENNIVFNTAKNFQSKDTNVSAIGWLYELPNSNDIKP